ALIPKSLNKQYLHNQRIGKVEIKDKNILNKLYLYFLMRTREYRHHVLSGASGTTVKHTSPKKIMDFEVKLPSVVKQKKIGQALLLFEKKIEVNNLLISNLEELAQT